VTRIGRDGRSVSVGAAAAAEASAGAGSIVGAADAVEGTAPESAEGALVGALDGGAVGGTALGTLEPRPLVGVELGAAVVGSVNGWA
jgi:hypothetical protein